jgi:hypothetical protein
MEKTIKKQLGWKWAFSNRKQKQGFIFRILFKIKKSQKYSLGIFVVWHKCCALHFSLS